MVVSAIGSKGTGSGPKLLFIIASYSSKDGYIGGGPLLDQGLLQMLNFFVFVRMVTLQDFLLVLTEKTSLCFLKS